MNTLNTIEHMNPPPTSVTGASGGIKRGGIMCNGETHASLPGPSGPSNAVTSNRMAQLPEPSENTREREKAHQHIRKYSRQIEYADRKYLPAC